ncbi:O38 family O-antigen polymerase, partial [Escherichia coli]
MNIYKNSNENSLSNNNCIVYFIPLLLLATFFFPLVVLIFIGALSPLLHPVLRNFYFYALLVFIIIFFSTLKPFGDIAEYLHVYHELNYNLIDVFGYSRFGDGLEFMFLAIMKFIGYISGGNDEVFLLSTYFLIVFFLSKILKDVDKKYKLFLLSLFFFNLGFIEVTSYFLRQVLSVVVFLYAINERSFKKYIFFLLSVFFHMSAVVNVFIYAVYMIFGSKKYSYAKIVFSILIGLLVVFFVVYNTPIYSVLLSKFTSVSGNDKFTRLPLNYII